MHLLPSSKYAHTPENRSKFRVLFIDALARREPHFPHKIVFHWVVATRFRPRKQSQTEPENLFIFDQTPNRLRQVCDIWKNRGLAPAHWLYPHSPTHVSILGTRKRRADISTPASEHTTLLLSSFLPILYIHERYYCIGHLRQYRA